MPAFRFALPHALAWIAPGLTLLFVTAGCGHGAPAGDEMADPAGEPLAAADRAAYEATIARLEAENRSLDQQLLELRESGELGPASLIAGAGAAELDARLRTCEADLARYKEGLERAVDELNASQRAGRLDALQRAAPPSSSAGAPSGHISSRLGPRVQIVGSTVLVTGELWSYRDAATDVALHLELLEDNRAVADTFLQLRVPAHTDQTYAHTFDYTPVDGATYSARASLSY
jgi:hypothetical protein